MSLAVNATECIVRRANLDDLPALKGLWEIARLPVGELEKRLTEVQVAARPDGVLLGAIALRVAGTHGWVHNEAFYNLEPGEAVRRSLWERLRVLARNHGLTRLWTRERGPFWASAGYIQATEEDLGRLPAAFGQPQAGWLTLPLLAETAFTPALEKELELFHLAEQEETQRLVRQATILKWIAALIALGFLGGALALLVKILTRTRGSPRR
jgi:N-acetylglutamate synthase-like GNAT family acetyltransferase